MSIKMRKGFALLSPERRRAIASLGGRAVKKENRSFSRDRELARRAAALGGAAVPEEKRTYSLDPELAKASAQRSARLRAERDLQAIRERARKAGILLEVLK